MMTSGRSLRDEPIHLRPAGDVREVDAHLAAALASPPPGLELALDEVQRALRAIDEDEAARPDCEDLAGELGPDRAAAAGDHDRPVADEFLDAGRVLGDHRPAQEVLDADSSDAIGVERAVEQVGQRRDRAHLEVAARARPRTTWRTARPGAPGIVISSVSRPSRRRRAPGRQAPEHRGGRRRPGRPDRDRRPGTRRDGSPRRGSRRAERATSTPVCPAPNSRVGARSGASRRSRSCGGRPNGSRTAPRQ